MLKGLVGIFYLFVLIIFIFAVVKFISWRMKKTFKPKKSKVHYAAEINPQTAAPQLLNQILLMLPGENNEVISRMSILMNDGSQADIDVLLICPTGLYLFNSINASGYVTGGEADRQWYILQEDGNKKAFENPLEQNRQSLQALLTRYPEIKEEWLHDYVVFSNSCGINGLQLETTKTIVLNRKMLFERLRSLISGEAAVLTPERVQYFYKRLKLYADGENTALDSRQKKTAKQLRPDESVRAIHEVKPPDLTRFSAEDQCLKDRLTAFTAEQSQRERIAAAEVLDRKQIENLVNMKPQSLMELETVQGMDKNRCEKYGGYIVTIIRQHYHDTIHKD